MSTAEIGSISSEFDIFAHKPVQTFVLGTIENAYNPIAPVDQNGLEFLLPADKDNYIRLDIQLYVRWKLFSVSGNDVDVSDHTASSTISSTRSSVNVPSFSIAPQSRNRARNITIARI